MKRILSIILLILLFLSGCNRIITTADISGDKKCLYSVPTLSVYQNDSHVYIVITDNEGVGIVRAAFLPTRVVDATYNLDLIENLSGESFIGLNQSEIVEEYGEFHTDIGSGFFAPAYITEDAYLIVLGLDGDCVDIVTKYDLIDGSVIERKTGDGSLS